MIQGIYSRSLHKMFCWTWIPNPLRPKNSISYDACGWIFPPVNGHLNVIMYLFCCVKIGRNWHSCFGVVFRRLTLHQSCPDVSTLFAVWCYEAVERRSSFVVSLLFLLAPEEFFVLFNDFSLLGNCFFFCFEGFWTIPKFLVHHSEWFNQLRNAFCVRSKKKKSKTSGKLSKVWVNGAWGIDYCTFKPKRLFFLSKWILNI